MHIFSLCHTGFGINSNILETNILNLAVVIYLLIPLKDTYFEVLEKRTKRIMDAMADAQEKYEQSQAALKEAKLKYVAAKYRAYRIRSRKRIFLKKYALLLFKLSYERHERIRRTRYNKAILVQKQALGALQSELVNSIFTEVPENCKQILTDPEEQRLVLQGCLARFISFEKKKRKFKMKYISTKMF